jgi:hypothetical protein
MPAVDAPLPGSPWQAWFTIGTQIPAFIILGSVIIALLAFVIGQWNNKNARQIVMDHLRATVGLPVAGVFSFLIVALFQSAVGQIQFQALGFQFSGASGPIIMWVFCFLAISGALRMLW